MLAVIPYDSEEEALEIANNPIYGLSAQVAAATNEEAYEFAKKLRTGTVSVNGGTWMHMDVPFGGFKQAASAANMAGRASRSISRSRCSACLRERRPGRWPGGEVGYEAETDAEAVG